jgi:hypothetical protein
MGDAPLPPPPPPPASPSALGVAVAGSPSAAERRPSTPTSALSPGSKSRAAKPQWQPALDYRLRQLPTLKNPKTKVRELLPFDSKTGRLCADNCCNRCCDPCNEGVVSAFAPFGSAMSSYFKLMKGFYVLFFLLACLAVPAVVINTFGTTAAGQQTQVLAIAVTTLGNLPSSIALSNITDPTITLPYTGTQLPVTEAAAIYAGLDFVAVIVFCLFYYGVKSGLVTEDAQVNKNSLGPKQYSIFLSTVPPDTTEEMVREWSKRVSTTKLSPEGYPVADVNIVDDNMGLLRIYQQRGLLFRALARLDYDKKEAETAIGGRPPNGCAILCDRQYIKLWAIEKAMAAMSGRIEQLNVNAKNFKSKGATAAFVTFESTAAPAVILEKFPPSSIAFCCQSKDLYFNGRRANVQEAPFAESVLWANLNIKETGRAVRQTFTALFAAALILLSFLFIVFASITNAAQQAAMAPADCTPTYLAEGFRNGTWTNLTVASLPSTDIVFRCFCDTQVPWTTLGSAADIYGNPWAERCPDRSCFAMLAQSVSYTIATPYCYTFLKGRAVALGLTIGATVSIALVNILLSMCMRTMSVFEGHGSSDDLDKALVVRLFFAQFMNTALLQIIINAAWDTITGESLPIPTGSYDDFNSGWYKSVGANFHSTMITLAITPHIGVLLALWGMRGKVNAAIAQVASEKEAARLAAPPPPAAEGAAAVAVAGGDKPAKKLPPPKPVPSSFKTQADLNETFIGPPVDYVLRYVVVLNVIFVCFVFSSGMPLMLPIAAVSLFISFNVDKLAFLYLAQRQPASANSVARYVVSLLPLAILLHLGVGVWMLGSVKVFRNVLLDAAGMSGQISQLQAAGAVVSKHTGILTTGVLRLTTPQTIPLVILFAGVLGGLVLQFVLTSLGSLAYTLLDLLTCGAISRCKCCRGAHNVDTPSYSDAISPKLYGTKGGITGVKSFNCLENPALQRTFGISPAFAAANKGLAAVAHFSAEDALAAAAAEAEAEHVEHTFDDEDDDEDTSGSGGGGASPGADGGFAVSNPLRAAGVTADSAEVGEPKVVAGGARITSIWDVLGGNDKTNIGIPNPYSGGQRKN